MFIPSIDAMWCECLTLFYKIGFSSFSTRSIVRGLKFERNEREVRVFQSELVARSVYHSGATKFSLSLGRVKHKN